MELANTRKDYKEIELYAQSLFTSFLELGGGKNTPVIPLPLIDNDTVQVLPVTIQEDGMGLKPGMQVDSTQVKIIGTTHNIDYKYIKETPILGNLKTYLLLKLNAIVQHHLMESDAPS